MQDVFARFFIVFLLVLYSGIALIFVIGGIRKWIWRPIIGKFSRQHQARNYRRIKSTSREGSPS